MCCIKRLEGREERSLVCKPPWKQLKWKGKLRATLGVVVKGLGAFQLISFFGAFGVLTCLFLLLHGLVNEREKQMGRVCR